MDGAGAEGSGLLSDLPALLDARYSCVALLARARTAGSSNNSSSAAALTEGAVALKQQLG